jgi:tRNA(Arg) A34 adenosine deaminase TadA
MVYTYHHRFSGASVQVCINIKNFMNLAIEQAIKASKKGEVPIGAVVCLASGDVIGAGHNETETTNDPSAHAEVVALRRACQKFSRPRLDGCLLFTTLEPCAMCADIIAKTRIQTVYLGALDPKGGALFQGPKLYTHPTCFHKPEVNTDYILPECGQMISDFFREKRKLKR